jgi:predicted DNA-binding transcriptional regulator AlpA
LVAAERDALVTEAAGIEEISKEEVHVLTGISRSTIDRILGRREE